MNRSRVNEILNSKGVIEVKYKNSSVWLESLNNNDDGRINVRDLNTNRHYNVDISELEE